MGVLKWAEQDSWSRVFLRENLRMLAGNCLWAEQDSLSRVFCGRTCESEVPRT
jgi:hypothetical protein